MSAPGVVDLVERIYDLDVPPAAWLARVVDEAARVLDLGEGIDGYLVTLGPDGAVGRDFTRSGGRPNDELVARFTWWRQTVPPNFQRTIHQMVPCGLASEVAHGPVTSEADEVVPGMGTSDIFGVNGLDASGAGCVLTAFAKAPVTSANRPDPAVWARVAAHLATGSRLVHRRWAGGTPRELAPEAVLTPDGRPLHLESAARSAPAQEALRRLAVDIDRARAAGTRGDPDEATRLWRALAGGRWSILDRFDANGRRFVVACANEAQVHVHPALSVREEQAVGYASLGHGDKLIAYEMGLTRGTVARLLSRARAKLGVTSRAGLIQLWLARRDGEGP